MKGIYQILLQSGRFYINVFVEKRTIDSYFILMNMRPIMHITIPKSLFHVRPSW